MKYWLIVNVSNLSGADGKPGFFINQYSRPTYLHENKELAEKELLRLQQKFPQYEFLLFEAVSKISCRSIINIFYVDPIDDISDDIPF